VRAGYYCGVLARLTDGNAATCRDVPARAKRTPNPTGLVVKLIALCDQIAAPGPIRSRNDQRGLVSAVEKASVSTARTRRGPTALRCAYSLAS
jgi:hypothetical protein